MYLDRLETGYRSASVRRLLGVLCLALMLCLAAWATLPRTASAKGLGEWTQEDVNAAIDSGVTFLTGAQNANGSFGTEYPVAETALAITSFGVKDGGHFANLPADQQAALQNAVNWLLTQQKPDGDFGQDEGGFLETYDTGLALLALGVSSDVPTTPAGAIPGAIASARNFLVEEQQTKGGTGPEEACQSTGPEGSGFGGQFWCGGWNYETPAKFGDRSDESNTGFAITGLAATGGVPPSVAALNEGWQRNVQEFSGNTFGSPTLRNDGGASYEPEIDEGDFSSNANDSGTNLFSFGFDGVPGSDPAVQASITFDTDVLNAYELQKAKLLGEGGTNPLDAMHMIYHSGATEDGACTPDELGCDWHTAEGEGGFGYSMFSVTKGFSQYVAANLADPNNYYAKVVDLLLEQQHSDGTWPTDPRDNPTAFTAVGFAILALGRVGAPGQVSGTVYHDVNRNGTFDAGDAGLGGWTVFIDVNGSGQPAGQPSAVTAANGTYSIQNIPNGTFAVRVVPQSGFTCTQPANGCAYTGQFASDVNLGGLNFGEASPAAAAAAAPAAAKAKVAAAGTAKIASNGAGACLAHASYLASVRGTLISTVTFKLDNHKIATLHKPNLHGAYTAHVKVARGKKHHLSAQIVFTSASSKKSTTLHQTLARCAVHKRAAPRFTG